MPHLFVNRLRKHSIGGGALKLNDLKHQFTWEIVNAVCYLTGGLIFIVGSVFFLPEFEEYVNVGAWLFIVGSFFYLFVSGHDLYEVIHSTTTHESTAATTNEEKTNKKMVDAIAATSYVAGGIVFIVGSYEFLPSVGLYQQGAYSFIFGSLLFIGGAVTNSIQIFDSPTRSSAMIANFTAVCYIIGSTLFLSGSVPYLWAFESQHDAHQVYKYLGIQFVLGSILFLVGGCFNLWRAYLVFQHGLLTSKDEFQGRSNSCPILEAEYHRESVETLPVVVA